MVTFTCSIVKDQAGCGVGFMVADKVILSGTMNEWPKDVPNDGNNTNLRLVLNEDNWPSVRAALFQLKPWANAAIPRDLFQYISETNLPNRYKVVTSVRDKQRAQLNRRRSKQVPPIPPPNETPQPSSSAPTNTPTPSASAPTNTPKPSSLDTSKLAEAAAKLAEAASKVRLPEPPCIPESAFLANNPMSQTFKFPKVDSPETESAYARAAFIARAEISAEANGTTFASDSDDDDDEDEEEEISNADSIDIQSSGDEEDDDNDDNDDLWEELSDDKPVKASRSKYKPVNQCNQAFQNQKDKRAKVNILRGRKKHPSPSEQKEKYGGKRGNSSILARSSPVMRKTRSAAKNAKKKKDDDDDYSDDGDDLDTEVVQEPKRVKLQQRQTETLAPKSLKCGSKTGGGMTFFHHVHKKKSSTANRYKQTGCGHSRKAGSRPRSARQQLDNKVREKMGGIRKRLETAQRMSTPVLRSDSFDSQNKDPTYVAERENEENFPIVAHMAACFTEQVTNGDGQNKVGELRLSRPQLHVVLDSESNQKALAAALMSGNLDIHTYNHFPDYERVFSTGIKRPNKMVDEEDSDDESADPSRTI